MLQLLQKLTPSQAVVIVASLVAAGLLLYTHQVPTPQAALAMVLGAVTAIGLAVSGPQQPPPPPPPAVEQ